MVEKNSKWYIVNTMSGSEQKVAKMITEFAEKKNISDRFERIVVPVENVSEIKKGKKVVTEKKIFPGYILLKMVLDDASWNLVKNIPKVTGFLGASGKPMPIPEAEVQNILQKVEEGMVARDAEVSFKIGENIKINDGPFETFTGVVDEVDDIRKRLKVSVSIFGRPTPVELEFHQVEKVK